MVYQWTQHKDACYRLYIEERKSLEEIMQHMRDHYAFNPSKRAFQQQFRRWGFPSKQNPAHRNATLVNRVGELWESNKSQKEMLDILNEEGYDLKERELMRLRAKNRWLLRIPNGLKKHNIAAEEPALLQDEVVDATDDPTEAHHQDDRVAAEEPKTGLNEILRKRKEMHDQRQIESDERWASKKRRRRTKGYAGLPADPPGPPRFPSETTLDEGKQFLGLDTKQYRDMRDQFQAMCEEEGVIKKTLAGTDKWQQIKERLIRENVPLQHAFWADKTNLPSKELALDVICTDVTKRIRSIGRRMTIAEAKNVLGINPEQSRQIRNAFYNTLQADKFTSKLETGPEHWQELKDNWVAKSDILQEVFATGTEDPKYEDKQKALEALCRDVMKRLRDDQAKQKRVSSHATGDLSTATQVDPGLAATATRAAGIASQANAQTGSGYQFAAPDLSDLQIDPSLLEAAGTFAAPAPASPTPVYIRPHAKSQVHVSDKMWLGQLSAPSLEELHRIIQRKWPNAMISRIYGVKKEQGDQEVPYLMEQDDELEAYLELVKDHKAVFAVQLHGS